MTQKEIVDSVLLFVSQWAGTNLPRIVSVFTGLLTCFVTVVALWDRRLKLWVAVSCLLLGVLLIVIGLNTSALHWLAETSFLIRLRILMGTLSFLVLVVTLEAIRRTQLKERYALLWLTTGGIIFVCAFFPVILNFLGVLLGLEFLTAVVAVVFTFLILVAFHFSVALSRFNEDQTRIVQRCALLEAQVEKLANELKALKGEELSAQTNKFDQVAVPILHCTSKHQSLVRRWGGGFIVFSLIILVSTLAVLYVGLSSPQAMIGDEVTHYYMLVKQAEVWPKPNFLAEIPVAWNAVETRLYPHTNFWHFVGAAIYRVSGKSFMFVQVYQALFWFQFLVAAAFLARGRRGSSSNSVILYLLILASLPMGLIFSVAFYQDVPVAAQVLTAFCLLDRRRWIWASVFMALALGIKETAILFLFPFFAFLIKRVMDSRVGSLNKLKTRLKTKTHALIPVGMSAIIIASSIGITTFALKSSGYKYYPVQQWEILVKSWKSWVHTAWAKSDILSPKVAATYGSSSNLSKEVSSLKVTRYETEIIANHPGDLRIPVNFILYGGLLLWTAVSLGLLGLIKKLRSVCDPSQGGMGSMWPLFVGLAYCLPLAYILRTAPDARFFLPGVPFLLLPFVEWAIRLPRPKLILSAFAAIAILQGGQVLTKTYNLRVVSHDLKSAIEYLKVNPPTPRRIFMYPEGNYRLFPVEHDWYMEYHLREFWKADNNTRLEFFRRYHIGAIVVKKNLIGSVDDNITNLGVYPNYFIRDIDKDARFRKVFDNKDVSIYLVPNM